MNWLWWVGPLVAVLVYLFTGSRDKRREAEVDRWRARKESASAKQVTSMPGALQRLLATTGGGTPLHYFEMVPKIAYLAIMSADATQGSDHQTVVAKLDEPGPTFTARPLPIVE